MALCPPGNEVGWYWGLGPLWDTVARSPLHAGFSTDNRGPGEVQAFLAALP